MALILVPSAARARGTYRTMPSAYGLIRSYAEYERTKKIRSCLSQGKEAGDVEFRLFWRGIPPVTPTQCSADTHLGFAELIAAYRSFLKNVLRVVQELHPNLRCKKDNYPTNTDHNVAHRCSWRTIRVEERRKLNHPLISFEPVCESGFPRIHTPYGVGSRESAGRQA